MNLFPYQSVADRPNQTDEHYYVWYSYGWNKSKNQEIAGLYETGQSGALCLVYDS